MPIWRPQPTRTPWQPQPYRKLRALGIALTELGARTSDGIATAAGALRATRALGARVSAGVAAMAGQLTALRSLGSKTSAGVASAAASFSVMHALGARTASGVAAAAATLGAFRSLGSKTSAGSSTAAAALGVVRTLGARSAAGSSSASGLLTNTAAGLVKVARFTGVSGEYLNILSPGAVPPGNLGVAAAPFTFIALIRPDTSGFLWSGLFQNGNGTGGGGGSGFWTGLDSSADRVIYNVGTSGVTSPPTPPDDVWALVAVVVRSATRSASYVYDYSSETWQSFTPADSVVSMTPVTPSGVARIGNYNDSSGADLGSEWYKGDIAWLGLWPSDLSNNSAAEPADLVAFADDGPWSQVDDATFFMAFDSEALLDEAGAATVSGRYAVLNSTAATFPSLPDVPNPRTETAPLPGELPASISTGSSSAHGALGALRTLGSRTSAGHATATTVLDIYIPGMLPAARAAGSSSAHGVLQLVVPVSTVLWSGAAFELETTSAVVYWSGSAFSSSVSDPIVVWADDHFELVPA